jgi:hypothetical protein
MAMKVAALAVGTGGAALALAAEAQAEPLPATESAEPPKPITPNGWSCWGPISRGPAAPPRIDVLDFATLYAEVPA